MRNNNEGSHESNKRTCREGREGRAMAGGREDLELVEPSEWRVGSAPPAVSTNNSCLQ